VEDGGSRLFAPVSSRGEAIGLLELGLDRTPDERTLDGSGVRRTRWPTS
jgi:hypothetical protein